MFLQINFRTGEKIQCLLVDFSVKKSTRNICCSFFVKQSSYDQVVFDAYTKGKSPGRNHGRTRTWTLYENSAWKMNASNPLFLSVLYHVALFQRRTPLQLHFPVKDMGIHKTHKAYKCDSHLQHTGENTRKLVYDKSDVFCTYCFLLKQETSNTSKFNLMGSSFGNWV